MVAMSDFSTFSQMTYAILSVKLPIADNDEYAVAAAHGVFTLLECRGDSPESDQRTSDGCAPPLLCASQTGARP